MPRLTLELLRKFHLFILFTLLLDNSSNQRKAKLKFRSGINSLILSRDLLPAISESRKKVNFQKPILNWVKQFSHFGIYCLTPCNSVKYLELLFCCVKGKVNVVE